MGIDYERLLHWQIPEIEQRVTRRDTILYALSVGLGAHPSSRDELRFVYEKELTALPTMSLVLGHPGFWLKDPRTGVDWVKIVQVGQRMAIHRPLPVEGTIVGISKVVDIVDGGRAKAPFSPGSARCTRSRPAIICARSRRSRCAGATAGLAGRYARRSDPI